MPATSTSFSVVASNVSSTSGGSCFGQLAVIRACLPLSCEGFVDTWEHAVNVAALNIANISFDFTLYLLVDSCVANFDLSNSVSRRLRSRILHLLNDGVFTGALGVLPVFA
jgi:hypothetical protein